MPESLRILILEDNPADAELIQFELHEAGVVFNAKVVMAEEAYIRAIQDDCPDLILSDYDLPTYNGALALSEARRRCPDTPFILVTGAVTEDRAIAILTQGAKDYVLKNRLQQRLVPAIQRALAEAEEQQARKRAEAELLEAHRALEDKVAERTVELQKQIEHRQVIEEALLKYNERLEILSYAASRLLVSDSPQQLVEEICLRVMEYLNCDVFFNFLVDKAAGRHHLNAYAGIPAEAANQIEWLEDGIAVCGCAARDGCSVAAESIPAAPDALAELLESFGIKAYACHPLLEQNRVIGTLSFGTRSRSAFSADEMAMMKAVADQVALAISRIRTQNTLRESEERYRLLAETMLQGAVHQDAHGEIIAMNPAAESILGKNHEQFLGSSSVSEEHDTIRENGERFPGMEHPSMVALRTGQPVRGVVMGVFNPKLGAYRWISIDAVPVFYPGEPNPSEVYTVFEDITERRLAEEKLRESEKRYRTLFSSMTEGFAIHEIITNEQGKPIDYRFLDINPAFERLTGLKRDDIIGKSIREVLPSDDPRWLQMYGEVALTGEPVQFENYSPPLKRHYSVLAYRPAPHQFAVVFMDITARMRAEEELRKSEHLYRAIGETIDYGIWVCDPDGRNIYASKSFLDLVGLTQEQCSNFGWGDVLHPDDAERNLAAWKECVRTGCMWDIEHRFKGVDGQWHPVLARGVPVRDEQGEVLFWAGINLDIASLKKAELSLKERTQQLEDANRELESFSYSVSHDLRAPLRAIDGYAKMILRQQEDRLDENARRQFNLIRDNARMMEKLIDDLLALSRLGREALSLSRLNVEELTRNVWEELKAGDPGRSIDMKIGPVPPGRGDSSLIKQVLVNILSNALKFTRVREVPLIEVGGYEEGPENVYYVRDNGVGFDMQYHDDLFGVFKRLHSAADYEGTGVGLAIAQRIVNRHGGRVWAESEPDRGATFFFTLPPA